MKTAHRTLAHSLINDMREDDAWDVAIEYLSGGDSPMWRPGPSPETIPVTRIEILEVKMSKTDKLRAFLNANIASGDISNSTIERMKVDIIAAELEVDALSIPICERTFVRAA